MPGGVGGVRASLASTRFDAAAGGNHSQSGQHAPCGRGSLPPTLRCSSELMIDRLLAFRAVRMQLTGPACLGQPPSAATARRRIRFWSRAPHVRWRGSPVSCSCSPGSAKGLRIPFVRCGRPIAGKPVKGRHWVVAPEAESGSCGRDAGAADRSADRAPDRRSTVRQCRALSGPQPRLPPPLRRARSSAPGRPCSCENT